MSSQRWVVHKFRVDISCHLNNYKPGARPSLLVVPPGWEFGSVSYSDPSDAWCNFHVDHEPTAEEMQSVRASLIASGAIIE